MRRPIVTLAVVFWAAVVAAVVAGPGGTQTPGETPFPAPEVQTAFVSAQTVAPGTSSLSNYFTRGSTVGFRAFAGENKTGKILADQDIRYFYVAIPGQPNVKLAYTGELRDEAPNSAWPWSASWTIPSDFPLGTVAFRVLLQTKSKQFGSFVQIPVLTSQLTVTKG